ncbi:MAG TPA: hypothetical protein VK815_00890 [Candidatus Acidoferrales bacterium]|jgi:hypothetical protein|nr:hypothetical protein [Candidatus Acidoferrales bacterium]
MLAKLESRLGKDWQLHQYPNEFCIQKTTGPSRLCFSTSESYVDLLTTFSTVMSGPFYVLYLLLTSRMGNDPGRYQSPELSREELQIFFERFGSFFEQDGRHHVWIHSIQDRNILVYDNHNVVYAYGPLAAFADILARQNFREVESIHYPVPHGHRYNAPFDEDEDAIMKCFAWKKSPLRDDDDP